MRRLFLSAFVVLSACTTPEAPPEPLTGAYWQQQAVETAARLQAVSAVSNDVVWASGTEGTFARTVDGGETWQPGQVTGAEDLEFRDVHAINADHAFLMSTGPGEISRIYRTMDGGASWAEVYRVTEAGGFFDCMSFWDAERGIVFSDAPDTDFMLMATSDGGDSWGRVPPDALEDAHEGEGAFAASGTCLLTGDNGKAWFGTGASGVDTRVFRTSDYGISWMASPTPIPSVSESSGIFTVTFLDESNGLIFGGEYTRPDSVYAHSAVTTDGGVTWTMTGDTGLGGSVFGSAFVPGAPTRTSLAVAPTGSAWSTDGGVTWERLDSESYWAVGASPEGAAWAVGPGGRVGRLEFAAPPPTS
ncbi:MAG: photosystem II stability/assembly factor-like uncharacterized protein [Rhodothermales bacterium]|jgi:photosystem II stability/assembly factor-like uncharacterized protein